MKVCILYHPQSEFARGIEEFAREFEARTGKKPELISLETRDGAATATLYDIVQYPCTIVLGNDGQVQKVWEGSQLPLIDEVNSYLIN